MVKEKETTWQLKLYITGKTDKSETALLNINKYCTEHLNSNYNIEIIDLLKHPELAEEDEIFAIPTLVRERPKPIRKIIGDLSNETKVLTVLEIKPKKNKT